MDRLQEAIFEIVKNENKRPINQHLLFSKLVKNNHDLGFVTKYDYEHAIAELVATNKVKQLARSGDLVAGYVSGNIDTSKVLKGKINLNLGGNGFITLDGETKSKYYVYKTNLNSAQNGDEVEFSPTDVPTKGELIDAIVTKVLSHAKNFYVGEVHFDKETKITSIKLDDEKSTLQIALDSTEGLVEGSKVLVEVKKYEGNTAYGTVSRIIGHKSDVGVDILSIVYDNGVNPDFPNEVIDYAKKITLEIDDYQRKIRRDLSDKPIVTIDPATSKDFDDAFYCEKITDDKYFLSVQIADVSHYVKHGSVLDKEALKRGCSIYLVDRVIPMLPHNLSDDVCSINPNVPRMAIACDMIIKSDGSFENIKVYPAIIKSHRRFAYDDVNKYFDGSDDFTKEEPAVKESIDNGKKLSDILSKMKEKRGYIEFEIPEPIIKVDEKGIPYEIDKRIQGRAQKMIEDFMVAANEAVTIYADRNHFPFIYRVHDKPNETRLKTFELEAKKLNFKINTKIEEIDSKTVSK
jgi:ribonuclease R